jgi:hypothetical protein
MGAIDVNIFLFDCFCDVLSVQAQQKNKILYRDTTKKTTFSIFYTQICTVYIQSILYCLLYIYCKCCYTVTSIVPRNIYKKSTTAFFIFPTVHSSNIHVYTTLTLSAVT